MKLVTLQEIFVNGNNFNKLIKFLIGHKLHYCKSEIKKNVKNTQYLCVFLFNIFNIFIFMTFNF